MKASVLAVILLTTPFLTLAQNNTGVQTITAVTTFLGVNSNHDATTMTSTIVQTITPSAQPTGTTNSTNGTSVNGTSSVGGNSTNATTTSSTGTPSSLLPTAPTSVDGGGDGGAPSPGATSNGQTLGPPDSFVAKAFALQVDLLIPSVLGLAGGIFLVML